MTTLGPHYDADATKVVPEPYKKQFDIFFYGEWNCEIKGIDL